MPYPLEPRKVRSNFQSQADWERYLTERDAVFGLAPQPTPKLPPNDKLLLTAGEAASLCGVGERTWHRMNSEQKCPASVSLNSSVRWNRDELREWTSAGCPSRDQWERIRR